MRLSALTEALVKADVVSAPLLMEIQAFAHRLRGAALVFGFQRIGECSKAAELAAISASLELSSHRVDLSVVSTMEALAISLANEIDNCAPQAPAITDSPGPARRRSSW